MVKEVSEVFEKTDSGATDPLVGTIDNKQAIIKVSRNTYGPRVLVNEFVCLRLAQILELPIPRGGIGIIDNSTDVEQLLDYEIALPDIEGLCFYSEKSEKVLEFIDLSPQLVEKLSNRNYIIRVILFDHFIHNKDRHDGNILLSYSNSTNLKFSIIDHSHVFNMGNDWAKIIQGNYNEPYILEENKDVYSNFYESIDINLEVLNDEARIFKERLDRDTIVGILDELPEVLLKPEEKERILQYLLHRLSIIDEICCFIYENIKCPGGEINEDSLFGSVL
ncbi:HipA family kinase [Paraclostridium bifermentans]|uniref:HipA family kinase n=1 Tax=Paraclostridium bifermentans TaxID=1490 RepID=UPI0024B983D1|nr:HipA family kinase [Paraclostridium bifermentans]